MPRRGEVIHRMRRVNVRTVSEDLGPCVEHVGSRNSDGYGSRMQGSRSDGTRRYIGAHRLAFLEAHGWLPETVRHRCDNPPCIRPDHLEAGTQADNIADRVARGRNGAASGESNGKTALNAEAVKAIRWLYRSGIATKRLAAAYGMSVSGTSHVIHGRTWGHVDFMLPAPSAPDDSVRS